MSACSIATALQFFQQGGFFMVLLMLCSVASLAAMILRGIALRRNAVLPAEIEAEIQELQPGFRSEALTKLARVIAQNPSPLAAVTRVGLNHLQWPKSENAEAVQMAARHELVRLESGLAVLEVVVGIAPLLGLLGAVSGLVTVFANMGASEAVSDPRGMARGISEALSTTIVGLAIAIPSLIAYSYFSRKIETIAAEMEAVIADLLAKCYYRADDGAAVVKTRV